MELVLLVGANPRNIKRGPRVRVHEGKWKLKVDGLKDSVGRVHLHHDQHETITSPLNNGDVLVVNEPRTVEIELISQGNEASLSVFIELM